MKNYSRLLNRNVLAAICATPLMLASASAFADEIPAAAVAAAPAAPTEPAPPYTLTYNLGLYSNYMFRGVDYTDGPAVQGGIDWAHSSGFYLGTWFSNLDPYGFGKINGDSANGIQSQKGNHLETDFYGGYATTFGDSGIGINLLANYYVYLEGRNSGNGHKQDTVELSAALSYKWLTYTFYYIPTTYYGLDETDKNFNVTGNRNTDGATYNELKVNYTLPIGDLNFMAKIGYQYTPNLQGSEADFAIGLNRNFSLPSAGKPIEGFNAGAYYTGTWAVKNEGFYTYATSSGGTRDANEDKLWFYVKRTW